MLTDIGSVTDGIGVGIRSHDWVSRTISSTSTKEHKHHQASTHGQTLSSLCIKITFSPC